MRYSFHLLLLGAALAVAGWVARAPQQPDERASYLCGPVAYLAHKAGLLEAALSDQDQVIPPEHAWMPDAGIECRRLVLRLYEPEP
jgi:hypothetical protein